MNEFEFEIPNFGKYNPRKDVSTTIWFRLSNMTFYDAKFAQLGTFSKLLWFYLMSEFSRAGAKPVRSSCSLVARTVSIRRTQVQFAVAELERNQMIKVLWRDADVTLQTDNTDKQTNNTNSSKPAKKSLTKVQSDVNLEQPTSQNLPQITKKSETKTAATWESFSNAYRKRYGSDPVRNATTNSQMSNVVKRIGEEEAPEVAAFFVTLNDPWYMKQGHAIGILLKDCEKIRTMWVTGKRTIETKGAHYQEQLRAIEMGEI